MKVKRKKGNRMEDKKGSRWAGEGEKKREVNSTQIIKVSRLTLKALLFIHGLKRLILHIFTVKWTMEDWTAHLK